MNRFIATTLVLIIAFTTIGCSSSIRDDMYDSAIEVYNTLEDEKYSDRYKSDVAKKAEAFKNKYFGRDDLSESEEKVLYAVARANLEYLLRSSSASSEFETSLAELKAAIDESR